MTAPRVDCPPLFLVGSPRSGTTLLRLMVDAHPDYAIPPETHFLPALLATCGTADETPGKLAALIAGHDTWPDFHLSVNRLAARLTSATHITAPGAAEIFYKLYAERFGKLAWGDKTPAYAKHLPQLAAAFPSARFIHIIRDGRDAALSWRQQWFAPSRDIGALAAAWREHVDSAHLAGGSLGSRYTTVRYEDLVVRPESELTRVCRDIGIPYHPDMAEHHKRAAARLDEHEGRLHPDGTEALSKARRHAQQQSTREPVSTAKIGLWRTAYTQQENQAFLAAAGETLARHGYDTASPAPVTDSLAHLPRQ